MDTHDNDKRRTPRLGVYHLAKYTPVPNPTQKKPALACIKDIGGGGVCLQTEESLPVGTVLHLRINMLGVSQPVTTIAKVTWTKQIGKGNTYEAGIGFLEIAETVRDDIVKRIGFASEASRNKRKK